MARPKKENPLSRYWIFLDREEAEIVRSRADELQISFSAYVRRIIQREIKKGIWRE